MKTLTNFFKIIAIGAVIAIGLAACGGKSGSGGGDSKSAAAAVKGTGKNYTLSKDSDFKYDLTKIDGQDYVVIQGINMPSGFKEPEKGEYQGSVAGIDVYGDLVLVDTLTVKIPEKIEGYTVGAIRGLGWFALVSVTIPDTVIEIGDGAFGNYMWGASISSIKLPKNLKKLERRAFASCKNLGGSITIPAGVTEIGESAFYNTKITEVVIPDNVTTIGYDAFGRCSELTTVKLPSHPLKYEDDSFKGCAKLSLAARNAIKESGYKGEF